MSDLDQKPSQTIGRGLSTLVSRTTEGVHGIDAAPDVGARVEAGRGSGHALPEYVRAAMEPLFGADFRGVRVHADVRAAALSRALEARAFTTGRDIFFGHGQYQPTGRRGVELLAHELTHVVQQGVHFPRGNVVMRDVSEVKGAADPVKDRYEAVADVNKGNHKLDILIDYTGSPDPRIPKRLTVIRAKRVMENEWKADGDPLPLNHEVVA